MIGFEEKWVKINVLKNGVLIWKRWYKLQPHLGQIQLGIELNRMLDFLFGKEMEPDIYVDSFGVVIHYKTSKRMCDKFVLVTISYVYICS